MSNGTHGISLSQFVVALLGGLLATVYLARMQQVQNALALDAKWPPYSRFARDVEAVDDAAVPSLLLTRVDKLNGDINAARNTLDAKATTMLGFLGGGVSVLAVVARTSGDVPAITPALVAGIMALFGALMFALAVIWGKPRQQLYGLDNYCDVRFLKDPENLGRLAALSCHSGIEQSVGVFEDALHKGTNLRSAQFFFALGAALLVLNSIVN